MKKLNILTILTLASAVFTIYYAVALATHLTYEYLVAFCISAVVLMICECILLAVDTPRKVFDVKRLRS